MKTVTTGNVAFSNTAKLSFMLGPCQMESLAHARTMAEGIAKAADAAGVSWVYKSSFDKANRTSADASRGLGLDEGMTLMSKIKQEFDVPVMTDIHSVDQVAAVAQTVDILQIPAFLSRQTDLLLAAGETGCVINVKKGQFLAPWDMENVAAKIASTGNTNILLCERGASFGYNMLVSDMRALPIMARTGYPVIFDATHSVQLPGGKGGSSDGQREFVPPLARGAVGVGCAGVFIETHQEPDIAPCDGPNMVHLAQLESLLKSLVAIDDLVKNSL
ncbi:MAG: 3-deoxy-8-phosphooctulonate synthase [Pseudomonadota bacterium]